MKPNRRSQERKQPERMVSCKLGEQNSGSVLNLSEDGLCFESLTPIEEKDLLHLRLSVDPNSEVEAAGQLAWIDSEKLTGGLRFLELSALAREQISAWLSETPAASSATKGAAAEKPVILQDSSLRSMQLVPIERHRAQARSQFLRGVFVGIVIGALVMIPILRYAGGTKPAGTAQAAPGANHASQASAEQTQASVAQPSLPSAFTSQPTASKRPATKSAAVQAVSAAAPTGPPQRQNPLAGGSSSPDRMTRASSLSAMPHPAKAEQPLGASQAAVASAPAALKGDSSSAPVQHPKKVPATPQQLWSAVQAGNVKAAVALADLYTRGEGVPVNCEQARVLLLAASEKKNAEASRKLRELDKGACPAKNE